MKTILRILLSIFIATNIFGFLITLIPGKYGKICAKELESPVTYTRKHVETRAGHVFLTGLLYSMYIGTYVSLYIQEMPGRCD